MPPDLRKGIRKGVQRVRRMAKTDPEGAQRLADEIEAFVERARVDPKVDSEALELLSGKPDPLQADSAIAGELNEAKVAAQKSDAAARARRKPATPDETPTTAKSPTATEVPPFEERVHFGDLENGRPTGVIGEVHPSDLHSGTETAAYYPEGLEKGELNKLRARRGHLLGNLFGGSGTDPRNLAWMHEAINNSQFKTQFENLLRKALEGGETVKFGVRPLFRGAEKAPFGVEVWMQGTKTVVPPQTILTPGLSDI